MTDNEPRKIAILQAIEEMAVVNTLNHAGLNTRINKIMMMKTTDLMEKKMMRNTTMKKLLDPDALEAKRAEEKVKGLEPVLKRDRFCWRDKEKDKKVAIFHRNKKETIMVMDLTVTKNDNLVQVIPMAQREGGNRLNIYHLKLLA
jgi:hypothetical protein